jgi:hypothetical protein
MPELPEVEVTRRGIAPVLAGSLVTGAVIARTPALRYPLPAKPGMTSSADIGLRRSIVAENTFCLISTTAIC